MTDTSRAIVDRVTRSPVRAFAVVFVTAFAIRSLSLVFTPPEYLRPETLNEPGRVAQTLVLTGQYANPYLVPTGPTAHPLPVYTGDSCLRSRYRSARRS